jgi:hypothetical protein
MDPSIQKITRWAKSEQTQGGFPFGTKYIVIDDPEHFRNVPYTDLQGLTWRSQIWIPYRPSYYYYGHYSSPHHSTARKARTIARKARTTTTTTGGKVVIMHKKRKPLFVKRTKKK